jgi:hypothetical protein
MDDLAHVSGGTFGGRRSKQFVMFLTHKQPLLKTGQVGERPDSSANTTFRRSGRSRSEKRVVGP